ncbi:MAG: N-acetyl-gamma-glutamyl-phosphate reductase [Candidatus Lokiarchaeota archaeon]|nr:N-acetyl-gamma-glutamyl-phosphate reductase [Candidatus Lokiarchaeota archaeon]MBD3342599.1 N-acetyl-gamma-glutamyl-phosphate reductase [Candidatus Lokiarchaeota archaeon]
MKINVGVIAASGYAGAEAVRILNFHPNVNLNYITSRKLISKFFHSIYPNFRKLSSLKFEEYSVEKAKEKCDLVFLAVPHGVSQSMVPDLLEAGLNVIDLSADFRLKNESIYQKYYKKKHTHSELFNEAVYGLPELHREEIRDANLVAVAGCHASSAIYGLYPLVKEGLIKESAIIIDSKTGSSGSGSSVKESSHHPIRANSIRPYKMVGHRHTGEIEQELSFVSKNQNGESLKVGFSAYAVNMVRGIISTSYSFFKDSDEIDERKIYKIYRDAYQHEPFIRLILQKVGTFRLPDPKIIIGTNYCDVGFQIDDRMNRIITLCALDNLVKGTAGNGIQCMNIMYNFPETMGLEFPGYFPL